MKKHFWILPGASGLVVSIVLSLACGGGSSGTEGLDLVEEVLQTEIGREGAEIPDLPVEQLDYVSYAIHNLPIHYKVPQDDFDDVLALDNSPEDNPITNEGATLGRVLFYDKNLSRNRSISCSSCHTQRTGFSDSDRFSRGFEGGRTARHSPGLSNATFYERGHFFWDERAATLEEQVLMPIQDPVEMGLDLGTLVDRLNNQDYYEPLFTRAFGNAEVTSDKIAKALAQFIRSMVSYQSKFDRAMAEGADSEVFTNTLTENERRGFDLFNGEPGVNGQSMRCNACHISVGFVSRQPEDIGLDEFPTDLGSGNGQFKAPSLRNVAVRGPFMHDGRFRRLEDVLDHYNNEIEDSESLNRFLRDEDGDPVRLNWTEEERRSVIDFLQTLTDRPFLESPLFSNPFRRRDGGGGQGRGPNGGRDGDGRGPRDGGGENREGPPPPRDEQGQRPPRRGR